MNANQQGQNQSKEILVAVAGNPNAGKSTLINGLAGTRLHVGNWPGVTVEKKEAVIEYGRYTIRLVDLPGTYSLSPYSQEELIARDFLVSNHPDVILNVIDSTNLERNLYLTVQLMELGIPIIAAMNMFDELEAKGYRIDFKVMQELLGVAVIPTIAKKRMGLNQILQAIGGIVEQKDKRLPKKLHYGEDIEIAMESLLADDLLHVDDLQKQYPYRWLALKLLENDQQILDKSGLQNKKEVIEKVTAHLRNAHGDDLASIVGEARYAQASGLTHEVMEKPLTQKIELTEVIDKIVLDRYFGIPIFFLSMWLMFKLTFDLSTPFVEWIEKVTTGPLKNWGVHLVYGIGASDWLVSLLVEGIIGGVGFVLQFAPVIAVMMFFITFMEGSGYMARAAFVMDRAMHKIGLHGKSFIPMIVGFGCNVPAIYATRILENRRDKLLTALLIPLMSCGARLPVYMLFVGVFFVDYSGTIVMSLYLLGIVLAILMGRIFKRTLFRGESPVFIMELPPYRLPSLSNLLIHTWEKTRHFIIKAGTYILAMSVLVWFFFHLPWGVTEKQDSYLGKAGQVIAPLFEPLGFGNWEAASSLITGMIAKEMVVGTMGEIYVKQDDIHKNKLPPIHFLGDVMGITVSLIEAVSEAIHNVFSSIGVTGFSSAESKGNFLIKASIRRTFSPLSAYSFMVFVLLYMPCMVTAIAFKQEFNSWGWFALVMAYGMILAWIMAFIIFQGGTLLEIGG